MQGGEGQMMTDTVKTLCATYPDSTSLLAYLESEEGGRFRVIDRQEGICLIRYEKGVSTFTAPHSRWFRSMVWDTVTNRPLCVAPPKNLPELFPHHTVEDAQAAGAWCEELLDGIMINAYQRAGSSTLYLATRSTLDASGHFYSVKSFRQLFVEAIYGITCETDEEVEVKLQEIGDQLFAQQKGASTFYSFLIQHRDHRVVIPITENRAYLLHSGVIDETGAFSIQDSGSLTLTGGVLHPIPKMPVGSTLVEDGHSWTVQGLIWKDPAGNHLSHRFAAYGVVKALRGNFASALDRFVHLFQQQQMAEYLVYFPEDTYFFTFHTKLLNQVIRNIKKEYTARHVNRTRALAQIDRMYHPHLYALHGLFLAHHQRITDRSVETYLREIPAPRVTFLLRREQDAVGA